MQERLKEVGSIPGSGRSPGGGHGKPLQYSCLGNLMDRGAWRATVDRVAQSWTRLKPLSGQAGTLEQGRQACKSPGCSQQAEQTPISPSPSWGPVRITVNNGMMWIQETKEDKRQKSVRSEKRVSNFSGNLPSATTEGPLCAQAHREPKEETEVGQEADWDLEQLTGRKFPFKKHKILSLPAGTVRSLA